MTTKKKLTEKKLTETIEDLIVQYRKDFELIPRTINNKSCGFFANAVSDTLKDKSIKVQCKTAPKVLGVDLDTIGLPQHVFIEHKKKYYDAERPEGVKDPSELPFYQRYEKYVPEWEKEAKQRKIAKIERKKQVQTPQYLKKELLDNLETEKWVLEKSKENLKKKKYQSTQKEIKKDILNTEKEIEKLNKKLLELSN
jgi:hypothetical protein